MKNLNVNVKKIPKQELKNRMKRFITAMDKAHADWEICMIVGDMSMYYLTGTISDGVLLIRRDEEAVLWVRRSYERALTESEFGNIKAMTSFRDIAESLKTIPGTLYLDMSAATLSWQELLNRYVKFDKIQNIDRVMLEVRSVKSLYELEIIKFAGSTIDKLLRENLPEILNEGMSETELAAEMFSLFIRNGYHGVSRFSMKNADVALGHICFGESSLYPSVFNGASGIVGLCPASPVLGNHDIKLKMGDLIYVDIGFGREGYNVDKTLIYSYKCEQPEYVNEMHRHCLDLERMAVSMMKPGAKPSDIYKAICQSVNPEFRDNFMGTPGNNVRFLGHGVGLYIDEYPVLAKGFDNPLECGMTIAVEPKISIEGVGMVGSENTYLITKDGAISLTGDIQEIILC